MAEQKAKHAANAAKKAEKSADTKETSLKEDILQESIADLNEQLSNSKHDGDKYLRAAAEIQNMNARFEKEQQKLLKYDGQKLAKAILPVVDNLERALATEAKDDSAVSLKKGVQMVYDHLERALKENGITAIDGAGDKFDPNTQQAVQTVAADDQHPADTVAQVLQKGYYLKDRVLRPAMVVVAK
ncbi:nucleotide exchange factor GrpE [Lacticaseibacillus paracasei]|uniref:nucleotide exchange factor GrpE n=1 Tax=Lacticaseibacillus paracasei TaxID=1597 RepID=UPI002F26667F